MADLAQFDIGARGQEARIEALLEDLTEIYKGGRPESRLALAVWWKKSLGIQEQHVLLLFSGTPMREISHGPDVPLYWKTGSSGPPFVLVEATDVDWFSTLSKVDPQRIARYQDDFKVLYFEKRLLTPDILERFRIVTEPPGLMKGWHITEDEYARSKTVQALLVLHSQARPNFGLVKTGESPDFENCRGILQVEVSQKWMPLSPEGIQTYTYYNEHQRGQSVYFLFEGGSLYKVFQFEVKTAPDYADRFRLLGKTPNDRYPEVYLRAVRMAEQSAT
jgi:hypothetical protein